MFFLVDASFCVYVFSSFLLIVFHVQSFTELVKNHLLFYHLLSYAYDHTMCSHHTIKSPRKQFIIYSLGRILTMNFILFFYLFIYIQFHKRAIASTKHNVSNLNLDHKRKQEKQLEFKPNVKFDLNF